MCSEPITSYTSKHTHNHLLTADYSYDIINDIKLWLPQHIKHHVPATLAYYLKIDLS